MEQALPRRTAGTPRTWALCLTSENHGTVGPAGCTFSHAPEKHERVLVVEVPAAANKAAEEGGLPELPHTTYNGYSDGSEPLWTKEQMHGYARQAITADRASRQVANKAEVDMDAGFLQWVHDRMRFVHGENENVDYMHKLRAIIASVPPGRNTPNVVSIATPPATTGASTVLTDERIDDDDGMFSRDWKCGYSIGFEAAKGLFAAQAGQVAVPEEALRVVRRLLDGSQPKDLTGAIMVIDSALNGGAAWTYDIDPPAGFTDYVQANYSGEVIFHDPAWHARRLWNAAMRNAKPPFVSAPSPAEESK
jgi:hypothetical protein